MLTKEELAALIQALMFTWSNGGVRDAKAGKMLLELQAKLEDMKREAK